MQLQVTVSVNFSIISAKKPVNTSNVIEVGQQIRKLSFPGEELTFDDVVNLAHVLENIVAVSVKSDEVTKNN